MIEGLDSFLQIGAPLLYITDAVILAAVTYLFIRRVLIRRSLYLSPRRLLPPLLILVLRFQGPYEVFFQSECDGIKELALD